MRTLSRPLWLGIVVAMIFAGYVAYPVWTTLAHSLQIDGTLTLDRYRSLVDSANAEAAWNSVWVSVLSVVCSGVVGTFLGFVMTQIDFPLKRFLAPIAILPIGLPPLVGVIAFLFVIGPSGILPRLMQQALGSASVPFALEGVSAILVVHVYSFSVYFYLFVSDALARLDGSVVEAAAGLGAGPARIIRSVVFPHLRPALFGASALTFMSSMASFSAPLLFAGGRRFITLQIYYSKLNGDMDLAAAQSVFLLVLSLVFFVVLTVTRGRDSGTGATKGVIRFRTLRVRKASRRICVGVTWLILFVYVLPLVTIVLISLASEGRWTSQILPPSYTAENYGRLFSDPQIFGPIANSLIMATVATAGALMMGTAASYLLTKTGLRRKRVAADLLLTMPYAIPGTVVAISLILSFNHPVLPAGFAILVGTFWILPLAYFVRLYPLVVRSTSASLERLDDSILEAAESFGAGLGRRFRTIVAPLIFPSVVSGGLLVFITAVGEFVSSILLYTYSNRPISVEILAQLRIFNLGRAAAYSVVLLVLILLITAIAGRLSSRSSRSTVPVQS